MGSHLGRGGPVAHRRPPPPGRYFFGIPAVSGRLFFSKSGGIRPLAQAQQHPVADKATAAAEELDARPQHHRRQSASQCDFGPVWLPPEEIGREALRVLRVHDRALERAAHESAKLRSSAGERDRRCIVPGYCATVTPPLARRFHDGAAVGPGGRKRGSSDRRTAAPRFYARAELDV